MDVNANGELKIKVWKDKMAFPHPVRWCWEVKQDRGLRVVGCGTTTSERASREAAAKLVAERLKAPARFTRRRRFTPRIAQG
ncbi:protein of unknown function [Beijerinckiaceae bacterium RH AL1]|jgi:hypothetical protein|nr:hypothetical protein [Beijerinckiaceae bacterium]VVB48428.1 protein of unknown function [Beijerinckiaceae bacterium RH CH11]VVB48510.1 protein of unknown function [Beijerinckiaceae bacterium RH AL8]VVC56390.1 protein of unknown function [Beijerinckiaceae bacterium RH AL1]